MDVSSEHKTTAATAAGTTTSVPPLSSTSEELDKLANVHNLAKNIELTLTDLQTKFAESNAAFNSQLAKIKERLENFDKNIKRIVKESEEQTQQARQQQQQQQQEHEPNAQ